MLFRSYVDDYKIKMYSNTKTLTADSKDGTAHDKEVLDQGMNKWKTWNTLGRLDFTSDVPSFGTTNKSVGFTFAHGQGGSIDLEGNSVNEGTTTPDDTEEDNAEDSEE